MSHKTKKVVVNSCHGVFDISKAAIEELVKMKSELVETLSYRDYFGEVDENYVLSAIELQKSPWASAVVIEDGFVTRFAGYRKREHEDLVSVVEKLGVAASGHLSELKIIEIPADVEYLIESHDGVEWVAEKHRTWR